MMIMVMVVMNDNDDHHHKIIAHCYHPVVSNNNDNREGKIAITSSRNIFVFIIGYGSITATIAFYNHIYLYV